MPSKANRANPFESITVRIHDIWAMRRNHLCSASVEQFNFLQYHIRCLRGCCELNGLWVLAAIALEPFECDQRVFHESRRQVVLSHLRKRLEDFEMMPPRRRPEHHMRLDRRTARDAAGDFRYHYGFVVSEREARLGPGAQAGNRRRAIGAFRGKAKHDSLRQTNAQGGSSQPATGKGSKSWRRYWRRCGSDPAGPSCANFRCRTFRRMPR